MHSKRLLYMMAKPTSQGRQLLVRLCAMLDIPLTYSPERWHATFAAFGESSDALVAAIRAAMRRFDAEPFHAVFDSVRGNTLQKRKGQRAPGAFHQRLMAHLGAHGIVSPGYSFDLHLNLNYAKPPPARHVQIPVFDWLVEEICLIESVYGEGRHIEHDRWRLTSRQGAFDFLLTA